MPPYNITIEQAQKITSNMAFGLLKRSLSTTAVSATAVSKTTSSSKPIRSLELPDATECPTDHDDDSGLIVVEAVTTTPELMELQHDLKAKSSQVSVLRDTLTNLSRQFRAQAKTLEESKDAIREREAEISRLNTAIEQWQTKTQQQKRQAATREAEWREKYNDLDRILQRAIEERDQWKIRYEELQFDQEDDLLGRNVAAPQRNYLWSDDEENDEQKLLRVKDDDNDSIWDEPTESTALDSATRPPTFTNRPRPFRRKKQRPVVKPFETKPMEWVTTSSSLDDKDEHEASAVKDDEDIYCNASVADDLQSRHSRSLSVRSDAKARAKRVRKAAKKMSTQAGFDCQKLEC